MLGHFFGSKGDLLELLLLFHFGLDFMHVFELLLVHLLV